MGFLWLYMVLVIVPIIFASPALDLSSPFDTISYNNFEVRLYKENTSLPGYYYYDPACIFEPNGTYVDYGTSDKQSFVYFSVRLWDKGYRTHIAAEFIRMLGLNNTQLRLIPFHSLRLNLIDQSIPVTLMDNWIPMSHQPSVVLLRVACWSEKECKAINSALTDPQDRLLFGLELVFKLEKPVLTKRSITFEATGFQASSIFSHIEQQFSRNSTACLTYNDLQRMLREVLGNIIQSAIPDDEFFPKDELKTALQQAVRLLKTRLTSTRQFLEDDWKSVFWPLDADRPEERVKNLNRLVNSVSKKWIKTLLTSGGDLTASESLRSTDAQLEWSSLQLQWKEFSGLIEWNGEAFAVKPMVLHCVSLTSLRLNRTLGNITVWTSNRTGDFTSAINTQPRSADSYLYEKVQLMENRINQTVDLVQTLSSAVQHNYFPVGTIMAVYQTGTLPECWLYCDGQSFNTSVYPVLASALYPQNNTPDLRGRVLIGTGANYSSTLGETGGESAHQLTLEEMPQHQHNVTLTYGQVGVYAGSSPQAIDDLQGANAPYKTQLNTKAVGEGRAHNNLPPYATTSFIIRAC